MKKQFFLLLSLACSTILMAKPATSEQRPGFGQRNYSVSLLTEYSYNKTLGSMANFDIQALMPINPYFEAEAKLQLSTANFYTANLLMRPKFTLPVGELFLEGGLCYQAVARSRQWDLVGALSLGYRMDYVSVQVGSFARVMDMYHREWHSTAAYNVEPFNLMYRIEVFVRPQDENWNLSLAIANLDDYQYERMWAPFFQLGGRYDIDEHWRVRLESELKLAGMFHLNAEFYSAYLRAGFTYQF